MNSPPTALAARRGHRKRISALRLSTDSTVPTLPLYTSPLWQRPVEILDDPSDLPPDYSDSAEEGDADTDSEDVVYASPPPQPLSFSPRRARRSQGSSRSRRQGSSSNEPYLDSLLARSVHALEMSNALLQSSMSTQSTLNSVLAGGSEADISLEVHARTLSSRITDKSTWMEDLDQISKGVEGLFSVEEGGSSGDGQVEEAVSQSLPASSSLSTVADRITRNHLRRPSLDINDATLHFSNHDRSDLVAPPPRALTMYVDSLDDPDTIPIPSTLGIRSSSRLPTTPLPSETSIMSRRPLLLQGTVSESEVPKRALDVLSSYATIRERSTTGSSSNSNSRTASPSSSYRTRPRSGSASTSTTTTVTTRKTRSPLVERSRSPSHSPSRSVRRTWDTPPIIELPSASDSSSSEDMHVDRTLTSLRTILQNNPPPQPKEVPKPSFLKPPTVVPIADTSHATASVSRLFTKPRHSSSTRAPSPPRVSAMKGKSGRSAPPTPISPSLSLSSSWISVSDAMGIGSRVGSGRNTPNRVSFAELPDNGRDKDTPSSSRIRSRSRSRSRKGKARGDESGSEDGSGKWWTWLLGPAPASGPAAPTYVRQEERVARGSAWGPRPGFAGSIEEWGV